MIDNEIEFENSKNNLCKKLACIKPEQNLQNFSPVLSWYLDTCSKIEHMKSVNFLHNFRELIFNILLLSILFLILSKPALGAFEHIGFGYGTLSPKLLTGVDNSSEGDSIYGNWLPHFLTVDLRWDLRTSFWNFRSSYNGFVTEGQNLNQTLGHWTVGLDYGRGLGPSRRWVWWNGFGVLGSHGWGSGPFLPERTVQESSFLGNSGNQSITLFLQTSLGVGITSEFELRADAHLYGHQREIENPGLPLMPSLGVFISLAYTWKVIRGNNNDYWGNRFQYWRKGEGYFGQGIRDWGKEPPETPPVRHEYINPYRDPIKH